MTNDSNFELAESFVLASAQNASVRALIKDTEASGIKFETILRPSRTLNSSLKSAIEEHREP